MNKKQAEDFIYKSYLKAADYQDSNKRDRDKRHPELTKKLIQNRAGTPCALITGSKGKGSVANMISQILQTEYKVGLMTSPHIKNFCERFKINGEDISDADFIKYITLLEPEITAIDKKLAADVCVSPMGIQAALALEYFNANQTDFNVLECGKGARFDDVNNAVHDYAVINSIFLEHTRELGSTLEEIAFDKAHIITGNQKAVFVAEQSPQVFAVIKKRADETGTKLKIYGSDFEAKNIKFLQSGMEFDVVADGVEYKKLQLPLLGIHQCKNCALAIALCQQVLGKLDEVKMKDMMLKLNWPGRMEVLSNSPFVMLDACINSGSCKNVLEVLTQLKLKKVNVIIGIPDDKDYAGVANEMKSVSNKIILTKSQNPHYVFTQEQVEKLAECGLNAAWTNNVKEAITLALQDDFPLVILGTTSVVSEVKMYFGE